MPISGIKTVERFDEKNETILVAESFMGNIMSILTSKLNFR
jgi:hypothetical protein